MRFGLVKLAACQTKFCALSFAVDLCAPTFTPLMGLTPLERLCLLLIAAPALVGVSGNTFQADLVAHEFGFKVGAQSVSALRGVKA